MRIGIVGCGYWGKNLVRNFHELGVLAAVCDSDSALATENAEKYGVPCVSFSDLLTMPLDGVVVATPAETHYDVAKALLMAKKSVFVEKPLALEVGHANELCQIAQNEGVILMVGHLLRYHPAFVELKRRVDEGELGRIYSIYASRMNFGKIRQSENVLWSFAPHDLSMILALMGEELPEAVEAVGTCHLSQNIHDITMTHLSFRGGVQAHIVVSWLHPYKEQRLIVVGEKAMAVFDDSLEGEEKLKLYDHQVQWRKGMPIPDKGNAHSCAPCGMGEPLRLECEHFLECLQCNKQPKTCGREGERVLRVLEAAQRSLLDKKRVTLTAPKSTKDSAAWVHPTAFVAPSARLGEGTKVWHFAHVMEEACIGKECVLGQNVMVGPQVVIGNKCKIQNNVSVYRGVHLEDGVFCGPSCVFTNVFNPRSEIERKDEFRTTHVGKGATIGANATIVCGVRLGEYCFVGAGAVVIRDVKPHAVVVGNPARMIGWMSHAGEKLGSDLVCPRQGLRYRETEDGFLEMISDDSLSKTA